MTLPYSGKRIPNLFLMGSAWASASGAADGAYCASKPTGRLSNTRFMTGTDVLKPVLLAK